nr:hypothetical protein [Tanacetum cinerariifolium]
MQHRTVNLDHVSGDSQLDQPAYIGLGTYLHTTSKSFVSCVNYSNLHRNDNLVVIADDEGYLAYSNTQCNRARIIEARLEDTNNQAVDTHIGDTDVKDKQEVKKADDQEIENIKDEQGKIVEDQQVSEADDDTNKFDNEVGYSKADGKWVLARRIEDRKSQSRQHGKSESDSYYLSD